MAIPVSKLGLLQSISLSQLPPFPSIRFSNLSNRSYEFSLKTVFPNSSTTSSKGFHATATNGSNMNFDWDGIGSPAPGWDIVEPQEYYFAIANASSLMLDGALLEEVLKDGKDRALRARRAPDVWLIMEPAFLDHPGLAKLKNRLSPPTAAIVSTNGEWVTTIVKELLPQTVIGKFKAPTKHVPNPFKCNLDPKDTVIGGGGVWH